MYKNSVHRLRQIVKVMAFYGFGYLVDSKFHNSKKSPENLRKAFEELGPTFIKIGQILSTRPDILPAPYITALSKLQDNASPEKFKDIDTIFFKEFNKSISDTFSYFNEKPLASASIAQVHIAKLKNGREVIVKIQRPHIKEKMEMDISILYKLLMLTKAKFADSLINPKEALDEILLATKQELNFDNESINIANFRELNKKVAFVNAPYTINRLCSKKVLTMERIHGFKIDNIKALNEGGYDLDDLARKLAISYFKQVFHDGFFHADPHPGNLLVQGGQICYIDFGLMGSLSKSLKNSLNDMILAVASNDVDKVVCILMSIAIKKGYVNRNTLYEDIDYLFASYLSTSLHNIKVSLMLQEIFDAAKRNNLKLPKEFTLLIRGLVILEGVLAKISPDIMILDIAIPYVKSTNELNFIEKFDFNEFLLNSYNFAKDTSKLPRKFIELTDSIVTGRAKLQLEHTNLKQPVSDVNKMVNRIVFAIIVSSMIMGSSMILKSNVGPKIYDMSIIGLTGFAIAAILGFWLLISILRSGKL